jgi:DNA-binding transcriptional ArsR family regulator
MGRHRSFDAGDAVLRIYFTGEDLARVRIAPGVDPLWEVVLALQMLRPQRGDALFSGWRREVTAAVRESVSGPMLRLLFSLTPTVGYFPDFLNPIEAVGGLDQGLEAIRRTGTGLLRRDLSRLAAGRSLPPRARAVAEGCPADLVALTDGLRRCHGALVAPFIRSIETAVERDRATKVHALSASGVEVLLRGLRPHAVWSAGELRVPTHRDQHIHLDGRGLLLVPSYFCVNGPMTMFDAGLPPVLIYPVDRQADSMPTLDHPRRSALAELMGATRATTLEVIGTKSRTTGELARATGIAPASASEHASVLRRAGLVTSYRDRHRVHHSLSPLGRALLEHHRLRT